MVAITLGSYTFDDARTTVAEKQEEIGGRDSRAIQIAGVIEGASSLADLEAALDAIMNAASTNGEAVELSLRTDRRLFVRRTGFLREVARGALVGSFKLELEARDPYEEAASETSVAWSISSSGATKSVSTAGNIYAKPRITLVASGDVVAPAFGDGTRTVAYTGVVASGETLVFDAALGRVTLEGVDVTPYTTGLFPRIEAAGTVLRYTDDAASSHTASVTVAYRDRWW